MKKILFAALTLSTKSFLASISTISLFASLAFAASPFERPGNLGLFPLREKFDSTDLKKMGFVEFHSSRDIRAPLALRLTANGKKISNQLEIFSEKVYAFLPGQSPIEVRSKSNGGNDLGAQEEWNFPIGTMVAHEVRFNDVKKTLFEVRIVEKRDTQYWGYGSFVPQHSNSSSSSGESESALTLVKSPDFEDKTVELIFDKQGVQENVKLSFRTVPQKVCAQCHNGISLNQNPRKFVEETGPCEFHPGNGTLRTEWSQNFFRQNGWQPFKNL